MISEGFEILDCKNIIKKDIIRNDDVIIETIKRPLPIFMLVFKVNEDVRKIYITSIRLKQGIVAKI